MRKLFAATATLWFLSSCTEKKVEPPPQPPIVPQAAKVAPPPAAVKIEEITVTTESPAALEAFNRGRAHAELGRVPEAVVEFEKAARLDSKFAMALGYLGFFTTTAEGTAMLERAVTLAQALPPNERLMVEHLRAWRQGDAATLRAQRKQLAQQAPTDWRVHLLIGMGAQEERHWLEAANAFQESIRLNPNAVPAYNLLGYALMNQGKFEEAITTLTASTAKAPTEANSFDSLGEAQLRAGQSEAAEASFAKAYALSPKFWAAEVGVAQSRFLRGNWNGGREALAAAQKAAERPADKVEAATFLVWSYLAEGRTDEALKAATAMETQAKASHQGLAYSTAPILRGIAHNLAGDYAQSAREVPEAMDRLKKTGVQGDGLATLYRTALLWKLIAEVRQSKIKDAERTFTFLQKTVSMSISSESTSTRSHAAGMLSAARGEPKIALQQLLECNEDDFLCRTELASVQEQLGDTSAAEATRKTLVAANRREAAYLYARAIALGLKSEKKTAAVKPKTKK